MISAQLAHLMDGDITVHSAPGCGSTFRFTARFARSVRPDTATVSPERLAKLRVLVVDDNEANRRILVEWLTSWRMLPTSASDAAQALTALASAHSGGAPFSLVLLDARMPDTDGVALAGEIRRRWEARGPRLILLSSDDSAELSVLAREKGVLAYLLKPVQQSELLEAIWAVMNLDTTVPSSAGPAGHPPDRSRPLRVLVAEDNELNVTLLRELLSKRGHVAQFARDGRAALELAVQGEFDLALLDRAALTSRDLQDLREAAHQLVGTVGAFSTITAGVASTLEDAAIREERESCAALVDRLDSQCRALLDATATLSIDSLSL